MSSEGPSPRRPAAGSLLRAIAALAAALPRSRPGAAVPAATAPFASAPEHAEGNPRAAPSRPLRRSMRASTLEGMFAEVVGACSSGAVLTGWAIHLGCRPMVIGLLAALPFLGQFVQLPSAFLAAVVGHRRLALLAVGASRQVLLPLAILPLVSLSQGAQQNLLIAVSAASALLGVVGNNAWVSWMGDLVPKRIRGRYFGRRSALCTLAGTVASVGAGLMLDGAARSAGTGEALAMLALAACLAGAVTSWLMARQHEPAPDPRIPAARFEPRAALAPLFDPRVRRFLVFLVVWNGAIGISGAYFTLHMLENLKMGFTLMALQAAAVAGVRMLCGPSWGRAIDRVGARPVLIACSFGISLIPLYWLFATPGFLWPIALDVVVSAVLWSGHSLAAFNLPLNVAPRAGRSFYLATFAMAGGLAYAAATFLGGALAQALPRTLLIAGVPVFGLHVLFVLSSGARIGAGLLALRIVESGARPVEELARLVRSGASELSGRVGRLAAPIVRR
ncbi:MAG: MFS transporter [Myxococcaceae bacterium]